MNSKKLVSVIVPIYNSEKYLNNLLENLIYQTYKSIEILLIDDGSVDNSLSICNKFKKIDNRIKVITKQNGGVSSARNKGIQLAKGDYIVFVDSDDNIDMNYIKTLIDNNVDKECLVKSNYKRSLKCGVYKSCDFLKEIISGNILGSCWGYLFDKEIIGDIYFDNNTSYMEDSIFVIQYLLKIKYVKIIKEDLYSYNYNLESLTTSTMQITKKIDGYLYSLKKIENILIENKAFCKIYAKYLNKRKIKILESEISKINDMEIIKKIINQKNVKETVNYNSISLKYIVFIFLVREKMYKSILIYAKIRKKIKLFIKGM